MTKQEWIKEEIAEGVVGAIIRFKEERPYAIHQIAGDTADGIIAQLHSHGAAVKVKCSYCEWSQFKDGESVGMTPCYRCNSTGYIIEPLIK